MSALDKYRFRPGLWGTLVAFAGTALFAALAFWQLGRADEKRVLQQTMETRRVLPAFEYRGGELDVERMQYRGVSLRGHFRNQGQLLIDNVVIDGRPGYRVITPFHVASDGLVLVDRGWVPAAQRRDQLPVISVDEASQQIHGRIDRFRSRPVVGAERPDPDGGIRWLYVDSDTYAEHFGEKVPGFVIRLAQDNRQAYRQESTAYDAKVGMHIAYAIQWAAFGVIAFASWLGLSLKRLEYE